MKAKTICARLLALALVLVLAVSLVPGSALAEDPTYTIDVSGLETGYNMTVSVYQIIEANFDYTSSQPTAPMLYWDSAVANWVKTNHSTYIDSASENAVTEAFSKLNTDQAAAFYDSLAAAIRGGSISLSHIGAVTSDGSCSFAGLSMGNYLLLVEGGAKVYRPSVVNRIPVYQQGTEGEEGSWVVSTDEVQLKSSPAGITKKVGSVPEEELEQLNALTGQHLYYNITTDVPTYPANAIQKTYEIRDTLPSQVTLSEGTISVRGYTDSLQDLPADAYQLTKENNGFKLVFDYDKISAFSKIKVTYVGILNETAEPGTLYENKAVLKYTNDPYKNDGYQEPEDTAKVYTYGIRLKKIDSTSLKTPLKGAQFKLAPTADAKNPLKFSQDSTGSYYFDPNGSETLISDKDGMILIKGLSEGKFTLTETKAPSGYVLPAGSIQIELKAAEDPRYLVDDDKDDTLDGYYPITVKNTKGFTLPRTGGIGTILFSAGGILMAGMGIAVIVLLLRKKKHA